MNRNSLELESLTIVSSSTKHILCDKIENPGLDHVAMDDISVIDCSSVSKAEMTDKDQENKRQEKLVCDSMEEKKLLDGDFLLDVDSSKIPEVAGPSSYDESLEVSNPEVPERIVCIAGMDLLILQMDI